VFTYQARKQIKELGYPVCDTALYHRITYQEAISQGMSVAEYEPGSKAAQEIRHLFGRIAGGTVTKKFDIAGRNTVQIAKSTPDIDQEMEHFIAGAESLTHDDGSDTRTP